MKRVCTFLALMTCAAAGDALAECPLGISQASTDHFFSAVQATFPAKCTFEGVSANRAEIDIRWSAFGTRYEPVRIVPRDCLFWPRFTADELIVEAPPELTALCPGARQFLDALTDVAHVEKPVGTHPLPRLWVFAGLLLALAVATLLAVSPRWRVALARSVARGARSTLRLLGEAEVSPAGFATGAVLTTGLAAALRFGLPVREMLDGGDIERLYRTDAYAPWEHLLLPTDYHHPGLWFALLHWPFRWSGHSVALVAAFVRLCAVGTVPIAGTLVARYSGRLPALLTMLCIALLPILARESQDISDVTLFVLLGLASLWLYLRAVERPGYRRGAAFGVVLGLSFHASYAAIVLAGAIALHVAMRRSRPLLWPLLGAAIIGSPRMVHVARILPRELAAKQQAADLPWRNWVTQPFGAFLRSAWMDYFTAAAPLILALLLLALWLGRRLLRQRDAFVLTAIAYSGFLLLQPVIRFRSYYAVLLPIVLLILVGSLAVREAGGAAGRAMAMIALVVSAVASAVSMARAWPDWVDRAREESASAKVIQAAVKDGGKTLAFNMGMDWTLATWEFLVDPYSAIGRCSTQSVCDLNDVRDGASDRRVVALANADEARHEGWQQRSVTKLQAMTRESTVYLLLDRNYPSDALAAFAASHCTRLAVAGSAHLLQPFETWRCPRE